MAQGSVPTGTTYDDDRRWLVPGDDFEEVLLAIALRDAGASFSELEDATGFSRRTLAGVLDRRDWYLDIADEHDVEFPDLEVADLA